MKLPISLRLFWKTLPWLLLPQSVLAHFLIPTCPFQSVPDTTSKYQHTIPATSQPSPESPSLVATCNKVKFEPFFSFCLFLISLPFPSCINFSRLRAGIRFTIIQLTYLLNLCSIISLLITFHVKFWCSACFTIRIISTSLIAAISFERLHRKEYHPLAVVRFSDKLVHYWGNDGPFFLPSSFEINSNINILIGQVAFT